MNVAAPRDEFQPAVSNTKLPDSSVERLTFGASPTPSSGCEPTRLLSADTVPVAPVFASISVKAPAWGADVSGLVQPGLLIQIVLPMPPLPIWPMPPLPIWSPTVPPTRLLLAPTTPDASDDGVPKVSAPAPPFQSSLRTM